MRYLFLTSSPFGEQEATLNEKNRFAERFTRCAKQNHNALMITSYPADIEFTERISYDIRHTMELAGIDFERYTILDDRNKVDAKDLVRESDFIILAGGHVATQNAFFTEIGLRDLLVHFAGTVLGISAGSMNSADIVYAQPEEEGEAADPGYEKFIRGLNLTKTMLIPHYQEIRDHILDGKKLFEEVTYPDSAGKQFIAICDGSYLFSDGVTERICGEAYRIKDGKIELICEDGAEYML